MRTALKVTAVGMSDAGVEGNALPRMSALLVCGAIIRGRAN